MINLHNIGDGGYAIPDDIKWFLLWLYMHRTEYNVRYNLITQEIWRQPKIDSFSYWDNVSFSSLHAYRTDCMRNHWDIVNWQNGYLKAFKIIK